MLHASKVVQFNVFFWLLGFDPDGDASCAIHSAPNGPLPCFVEEIGVNPTWIG